MDVTSPHNLAFAESLYEQYLLDPESVDRDWRAYFDRIRPLASPPNGPHAVTAPAPGARTEGNGHGDVGTAGAAAAAHAARERSAEMQDRVFRLINAYRERGHRYARLDVLGLNRPPAKGPELASVGLSEADLDTTVATGTFPLPTLAPLREVVAQLQETYCRTIGVEFFHIDDSATREWLQTRMESTRNRLELSRDDQLHILTKLTEAETFEQFLHTKFVGAKRFSLEGAESLIPMLDLCVESLAMHGVREVVFGMAHRGRLNVLVNIVRRDPESVFAGFDDAHPEAYVGTGDVKYHLGYSTDVKTRTGKGVHLSLCFNPSHLEWVNSVVEGRVRAKQERMGDAEHRLTVPLLIHGDAAFAGQGTVLECMQLSQLRGYATGGTIHVVVNNQIGFTTSPSDSRSTPYATDIGRMFHIPVFHVNGEDPEAVAQVVKLAVDFRQQFARDVIIDLYCYRRHGHNEGDEPSFTQPHMYKAIARKRGVREEYVSQLVGHGKLTPQEAEGLRTATRARWEQSLQASRKADFHARPISALAGLWSRYRGGLDVEVPEAETAVPLDRVKTLLEKLGTVPPGFGVHPKLVRFLEGRRDMAQGRRPLDWGAAEALAFASLVTEGNVVRLSGQDSGRGTFSHRHSVLRSVDTGEEYAPLANLSADQARFEVWDSALSEAGVMGFDYGYSLDYPDALVIWEAQFGDFANGAQVIIDQFLSSAETKWNRLSGLCLFLPHGYEGQGPEHSSARVGRFLHLCARDNMQVCNVTTPAQLFHLLRRQVVRPFRKPLVLFTPKSLLRHKSVVSPLADFSGGGFKRVLGDRFIAEKNAVRRIVLCSGKIYFDLEAARLEHGIGDVAIVRLEQLYPFPAQQLSDELNQYPAGTPLVFVQEEPWNQGAWHMVRGRMPEDLLARHPLTAVTRPESASPATGSMGAHKLEQARLVEEAVLRR